MAETSEHGGNIFALARALGIPPDRLIDFSASINPLGPSPGVKHALNDCFHQLLHYPDRSSLELRSALARHHGLEPENIVVSNGSTELIHLLPRARGAKRALIIAPAFSEYAQGAASAGCSCDYFTLSPANGFDLSLTELAVRLREGYDVLFLCNPGNPTGAIIPHETCANVLEICKASGTFLVLDEAFMDFCEQESSRTTVAREGGGIILRSMTKFYAIPGLRLGYAIGAPDVMADLTRRQEPWSVNTAAQLAGVASLADQSYHIDTLHFINQERALLFKGLKALPGLTPYPSAANYILVETGNPLRAAQLYSELLLQGIIIRNCDNFQGLGDRFFRVAVRTRDENARLLEQLDGVLRRLSGD